VILRYELNKDPFFAATATLLTIHNLAFQGIIPFAALGETGLDASCFTIDRLEYYGQVNLLKGAIISADLVNTVSGTYCREILTPEFGCGLEGVLAGRGDDLSGILNGIDQHEWNPATDRQISKTYSLQALAGRAANKRSLQRKLSLETSAGVPLIGMVTRMTEQKGLDLVVELLPHIANSGLQLALLGSGEPQYEQLLAPYRPGSHPTISYFQGFSPDLAAMIYAGTDIFLVPSRFEPCGLTQMIALRYGSVPVVRRVGGLADTVFDVQAGRRLPNGFTFTEYSVAALWEALSRATAAYADKAYWRKLQKVGMAGDYSWRGSARSYEELYRHGLARKGG
jgi:starch synthase